MRNANVSRRKRSPKEEIKSCCRGGGKNIRDRSRGETPTSGDILMRRTAPCTKQEAPSTKQHQAPAWQRAALSAMFLKGKPQSEDWVARKIMLKLKTRCAYSCYVYTIYIYIYKAGFKIWNSRYMNMRPNEKWYVIPTHHIHIREVSSRLQHQQWRYE